MGNDAVVKTKAPHLIVAPIGMTNEQKAVKRVLEKVWDSTFAKEVGTRWILLQIAKEEGVKLDRELKRYGGTNKPV